MLSQPASELRSFDGGDAASKAIVRTLVEASALQSFAFCAGRRCSDQSACVLVDAVLMHGKLKSFTFCAGYDVQKHFSRCGLALARGVKINSTLQKISLDVRRSGLDDEAVASLARSLGRNKTLRSFKLMVRGQAITDVAGVEVATALLRNDSLRKFHFLL